MTENCQMGVFDIFALINGPGHGLAQVPDALTYDVSWTNFAYEKLENYNWNYVDQYLCTRGEDDFDLRVWVGFYPILTSGYGSASIRF